MSKNLAVTIALFAVALLSANSAVWGQVQNPIPNQRVDRAFGLVDVPSGPGAGFSIHTTLGHIGYIIGSYYDPRLYDRNDPDSFPASHITRPPYKRPIAHFVGGRIEYLNAPPSAGNFAGAANRLWNTAYFAWGYCRVSILGSIDPSMNCHGFSTGLNTWINDMETLVADEYEFTRCRDHLAPGAIFFRPFDPNNWITVLDNPVFRVSNHSSRIDTVNQIAGTHDKTVTVVEKNRVSALYTKTFTMQALCPNNCHLHSGPCNMANAPLPWSPIGFFRKLP